MKIGYPCINRTLKCQANKTFRLKSYSQERLIETVQNNIECTEKILNFNVEHNLLFFRITSDFVPFASHPICEYNWQDHFAGKLMVLGGFINEYKIRISMHPDQFTLINALDIEIFNRSHAELLYHAQVLDLMGLDSTAKIQIHVGGIYGDKSRSISRFINRFDLLDSSIQRRLVIENDERLYSLEDCLLIHQGTGIPVLFDTFHHSILNNGESTYDALRSAASTWDEYGGIPMVDYSSQKPDARPGSHADSINTDNFRHFIHDSKALDFDIMLEVKDKESSALKALQVLKEDRRFVK